MSTTSPVIALSALVGVLSNETSAFTELLDRAADGRLVSLGLYLLALVALVFVLVLSEYCLVLLTSSLTVTVLGVFKELLTVIAAVAAGDRFSALNALGLAFCLSGNMAYFMKRTTRESGKGNVKGEERQPVIELGKVDSAGHGAPRAPSS